MTNFCGCRYAIAMGMRDNQKIVYTSPLKVKFAQHMLILATFGESSDVTNVAY